ncbi:MAG: hypothetical protein A2Y33_01520 [Spirochaetes bacterium GWF1_51_8]|nr:MAG: hypothetical protein A2Y33_01520 [Spirochaetes bacterium GWF1_51_8]
MENGTGVFVEKQKMSFWWVWIIVIASVAFAWYLFIGQIILGHQLGSKPAPDFIIFIVWVTTGILFPLIFLSIRLSVRVAHEGVFYRFFPFQMKERIIAFSEIVSAEAVEYKPILEYGGWGIRRGKNGWAYTMTGKRGVRITTAAGKTILLGSLKADELANAINSLRK